MMTTTTAPETVESYADVAIERWQRDHSGPRRAGGHKPHHPEFCDCIVCADGREMIGQRGLIPLWARRPMREVSP